MTHAFYTIGHGRRPIGEFVDLLREVEVTLLADFRTMPRSRANPQFNRFCGDRAACFQKSRSLPTLTVYSGRFSASSLRIQKFRSRRLNFGTELTGRRTVKSNTRVKSCPESNQRSWIGSCLNKDIRTKIRPRATGSTRGGILFERAFLA
jgi:hypothetical protein